MRTFEVGARRTLGNGERFAELRCTTDRHYKAYILTLTRVSEADAGLNAEWMVTAFWGRIGASVQSQVKYHGTDHKEATRAFEEWMRRKMKPHGADGNFYRPVTDMLGEQIALVMTQVEALEVQVAALEAVREGRKATFETEDNMTFVSFLEV